MEKEPREKETIRQWYERVTRKSKRILLWVGVISAILGVLSYCYSPYGFHVHMQTFNGAITIPVAAGLWLVAFVVIWLLPMREVSFRGQDAFEDMQKRVNELFQEVKPMVEQWKRIGDRVETQLDSGLADEVRAAMKEFREFSQPKGLPPSASRGLDVLMKKAGNGGA
jgi:hypothetical protein